MTNQSNLLRRALLAASLAGAGIVLSGCAPLVVGGAFVGGSLSASDRRTFGMQTEDQGIEFRVGTAIEEALQGRGHLNVTSYNRLVLLTGEMPTEADRALAESTAAKGANVKSVVNDLVVMGNSSLTARSNDSFITGKVKASFVEAKDIFANTLKVVTERGQVYLMGIVTEREGQRASDIASRVPGVQKVVRVYEYITEDELKKLSMDPTNQKPAEPAPAR
jgi:osmotically-inducible protein OsmY